MSIPDAGKVGWEESPAAQRPSAGTFRLLLRTSLGAFVAGKLATSIGIWIHNIVAAVVVFDLTRSAFLVGTVSMAQFAPQVLFSPWMGAVADRGGRRGQVVVGRLLIAAGSGGLAVLIGLVGVDGIGHPAPILISAGVVGIGLAVADPAQHALVPALAGQADLPSVVALTTMPGALARAIGPALGALLLVSGGPAVAFGVAAAGHIAYALVVSRLRFRPVEWSPTSDRSVSAVFRYVRAHSQMALLLLGTAAVGFGVDPVITLTPALSAGFGAGPGLVALMASTFGAGAALTALLLGLAQRRAHAPRMGSVGLGVMAGGMGALALSPGPIPAVLSLFVAGVGMMIAITAVTTQIQRRVPEELRGRLMALWAICFVGSRPAAAALHGAIADTASPQMALGVLSGLLLLAAFMVRPSRTAAPHPGADDLRG